MQRKPYMIPLAMMCASIPSMHASSTLNDTDYFGTVYHGSGTKLGIGTIQIIKEDATLNLTNVTSSNPQNPSPKTIVVKQFSHTKNTKRVFIFCDSTTKNTIQADYYVDFFNPSDAENFANTIQKTLPLPPSKTGQPLPNNKDKQPFPVKDTEPGAPQTTSTTSTTQPSPNIQPGAKQNTSTTTSSTSQTNSDNISEQQEGNRDTPTTNTPEPGAPQTTSTTSTTQPSPNIPPGAKQNTSTATSSTPQTNSNNTPEQQASNQDTPTTTTTQPPSNNNNLGTDSGGNDQIVGQQPTQDIPIINNGKNHRTTQAHSDTIAVVAIGAIIIGMISAFVVQNRPYEVDPEAPVTRHNRHRRTSA